MSEDEKLKLKQEQLDFQKKNLDLFQDLIKGQAKIKELIVEILHHHGKQALVVLIIVFLAGVIVGTGYESWLPYIDSVINTFKSANSATKALN